VPRIAEGWRLRLPKGRLVYIVRFTHNGVTVDRSTGQEDPRAAQQEAARIYADYVQREPERQRVPRGSDSAPLEELIAAWLEQDATIDEDTVGTWTVYGRHWLDRWSRLGEVTEASGERYRNERLRVVMATTVRKELSALRHFLKWAASQGHLRRKVEIPGVPEKATGTRYAVRRRQSAPELSPAEVRALLAALPEWSSSKRVPKFPIRARFVVAYETSLRPGALDRLSVPEHYTKGARRLRIAAEIDKSRYEREVPLSPKARAALRAVAPETGLIFGKHDYREHLEAAARKALPPETADRFCGAHFRSAFITHALEKTGNLAGVQHMAGHKQAKTTGGYARPSLRAAEDALAAFRGRSIGDARRRNR
jgi:site-specific recombinase XerD